MTRVLQSAYLGKRDVTIRTAAQVKLPVRQYFGNQRVPEAEGGGGKRVSDVRVQTVVVANSCRKANCNITC